MRIKPAPGLKIRDPITKLQIPDDGYDVSPTDFYWARRLRDKDVVRVAEPNAEPASAAPAANDSTTGGGKK